MSARVFSPLVASPPAEVVAKIARGATVRAEAGPHGWRALRIEGSGLALRLRDTGILDGAPLLEAIRAAKTAIVASTPKGPTAAAFRLHRFVGRARHVIELEGIDVRVPEQQGLLMDLAHLVHGVAQIPNGFLDDEARWILDARGNGQPGAGPRPLPAAQERRQRSQATLRALGIVIPDGLSLVESETEVVTCRPADAKLRALALHRVFREVCGAPELTVERDSDVRAAVQAALTPREQKTLATRDAQSAGVGVESLWTLAFVLGAVPSLGAPGRDCDAASAVQALDALSGRGPLDDGTLRPVSEILDALDLHQCLAWARGERRGEPPEGMKGYVIDARLRALRWVVMDQYAEWDAVALDA